MASYPAGIYSPREKENRNGVVYDADKKSVIFKEDIENSDDEIIAIETELGANPKGSDADVKDRLDRMQEEINEAAAKSGKVVFGMMLQGALGNVVSWYHVQGPYAFSSEAEVQTPLCAGTLKKFVINVIANPYTEGSVVITIRKNGADTALTLTVGFGDTGIYTIASDVAVADNDLIAVKIDPTSCDEQYGFNYNFRLEFEPTA